MMPQTLEETIAYQNMIHDLNQMSKEDIDQQLLQMGCAMKYEDIQEQLKHTYNELSIADRIFETCDIREVKYPKSWIDEVVLEIAMRENYGFLHYGILSSKIRDIMNKNIAAKEKMDEGIECYQKLCQTAKRFGITAMETMQYQVNDGVDLYACLMDLLDFGMQEAEHQPREYRRICDFCEKLLKTFSHSHPLLRASIQYEQATAYIKLKSKKGEQIFQKLLNTHSDPCDVVLHYALAYLDQDEARAARILQKYKKLWDPQSDAYAVIQQILKEIT